MLLNLLPWMYSSESGLWQAICWVHLCFSLRLSSWLVRAPAADVLSAALRQGLESGLEACFAESD